MTRTTAIVNQKGGVGKTTTAVSLAAAYADLGRRTLLVDCDAQGSASAAAGINLSDPHLLTLYDLMVGYIEGQDYPNLDAVQSVGTDTGEPWDMIPARIELSAGELKFANVIRREYILQGVLEALAGRYDEILIDCPPTLTLLTVNALTSAQTVLVPVVPDFLSARGLADLIGSIRLVRQQRLNPTLAVAGVLLTRVKPTTLNYRETRPFIEQACRAAQIPLLPVEIPDTVRAATAAGTAVPLVRDKKAGAAAEAYRELARLLLAPEARLAHAR